VAVAIFRKLPGGLQVISGSTTRTARRTLPDLIMSLTAISIPKVADEQATFMSKPKP
jgi:hypothetical protein